MDTTSIILYWIADFFGFVWFKIVLPIVLVLPINVFISIYISNHLHGHIVSATIQAALCIAGKVWSG